MASKGPGAFNEEDTYLFRSMNIVACVMQKYMYRVFQWGTVSKRQTENIFDYLQRKNDAVKTYGKFKKATGDKQRRIIYADASGSTYDISLLYLCIMFACDHLKPPNDASWRTQGMALESLVFSTKEFRNDLSHAAKKMSKTEFIDRTEQIKEVLEKLLRKAGSVYNIDSSIVSTTVTEMCDQVNYVRDSSLVPQNYTEYEKLNLFVELRTRTCRKAKVLLENRYKELEYVLPIPKWSHFKFKAGKIYADMLVRDISGKAGDVIEYKDILKDHKQSRNDPVILVEATSGMGKTVFMKLMISDWISGQCVMKGLGRIELLIYVECSNSSIDSFQKLLEYLVPDLCKDFMGNDMMKIVMDLKILVLVDGLDELNAASTDLLKQVLELKIHFGITILATSRPDRVTSFYNLANPLQITIRHIHLVEIPEFQRNNFVTRYQKEMENEGIGGQDSEDLLQILQKEGDHHEGLWKSPYNLALTHIMWNNNPAKVNSITTHPELYFHIHGLSIEKLLERLQRHKDSQNWSHPELKEKVPHFTYALCKEGFNCLKNDEQILSEESVKRLLDCCNLEKLPPDEMLGSFLQEDGLSIRSSNGRQLRFTHKRAQDFLASLYCWFELQGNIKSPDKEKYLKEFEKVALAGNLNPAERDKVMAFIHDELNKLSRKAPDEENTFIRNLLGHNEDIHKLKTYKNMLINLLGILYVENITGMENTKKEILNLLQESGVNTRDQWLDVLSSVNCDDFVLKYIAGVPGVLEGTVEIENATVFPYAQLFKLKQPKSVTLKVTGDPNRILRLKELFALIRRHGIKVESVKVNDNNVKMLLEELALNNLLSVDLTSEMEIYGPSMNEFLQKISKYGISMSNLCLHHHHRHPKSPVQFGCVLEHLDKRYSGLEYVGPITESTTLPLKLRRFLTSVSSSASYDNLCNMVTKIQHQLEMLSVCLPLSLSHNSLQSINVNTSEQRCFILQIPDVNDNSTVEEAVCLARKVTRDIRCVLMICFPRVSIDCHQMQKLLLSLSSCKFHRLSSIFLPEDCCSSENEKSQLRDIARNNLSCTLQWEEEETLWDSRRLSSFPGDLKYENDDPAELQKIKSKVSGMEDPSDGLSSSEREGSSDDTNSFVREDPPDSVNSSAGEDPSDNANSSAGEGASKHSIRLHEDICHGTDHQIAVKKRKRDVPAMEGPSGDASSSAVISLSDDARSSAGEGPSGVVFLSA